MGICARLAPLAPWLFAVDGIDHAEHVLLLWPHDFPIGFRGSLQRSYHFVLDDTWRFVVWSAFWWGNHQPIDRINGDHADGNHHQR